MAEGGDVAQPFGYAPFEEHAPESIGRETYESDILAMIDRKTVYAALQGAIRDGALAKSSALAATKGRPREMKQQLQRGVRVLLAAACDKRVETLHYMLEMAEDDGSEVLFWIFIEVENQLLEAEEKDKEMIEKIFGVEGCDI